MTLYKLMKDEIQNISEKSFTYDPVQTCDGLISNYFREEYHL